MGKKTSPITQISVRDSMGAAKTLMDNADEWSRPYFAQLVKAMWTFQPQFLVLAGFVDTDESDSATQRDPVLMEREALESVCVMLSDCVNSIFTLTSFFKQRLGTSAGFGDELHIMGDPCGNFAAGMVWYLSQILIRVLPESSRADPAKLGPQTMILLKMQYVVESGILACLRLLEHLGENSFLTLALVKSIYPTIVWVIRAFSDESLLTPLIACTYDAGMGMLVHTRQSAAAFSRDMLGPADDISWWTDKLKGCFSIRTVQRALAFAFRIAEAAPKEPAMFRQFLELMDVGKTGRQKADELVANHPKVKNEAMAVQRLTILAVVGRSPKSSIFDHIKGYVGTTAYSPSSDLGACYAAYVDAWSVTISSYGTRHITDNVIPNNEIVAVGGSFAPTHVAITFGAKKDIATFHLDGTKAIATSQAMSLCGAIACLGTIDSADELEGKRQLYRSRQHLVPALWKKWGADVEMKSDAWSPGDASKKPGTKSRAKAKPDPNGAKIAPPVNKKVVKHVTKEVKPSTTDAGPSFKLDDDDADMKDLDGAFPEAGPSGGGTSAIVRGQGGAKATARRGAKGKRGK